MSPPTKLAVWCCCRRSERLSLLPATDLYTQPSQTGPMHGQSTTGGDWESILCLLCAAAGSSPAAWHSAEFQVQQLATTQVIAARLATILLAPPSPRHQVPVKLVNGFEPCNLQQLAVTGQCEGCSCHGSNPGRMPLAASPFCQGLCHKSSRLQSTATETARA